MTICFRTEGQYAFDPDYLVGADLVKARESLSKSIQEGQDSLTIYLAEVLFFSGNFEQAFKMYQRADSLRLIKTYRQRRNFEHAAKLIRARSPYENETNYFQRNWYFDLEIKPFCGNSENEDFAPFRWNNTLFVTSSRGKSRRTYDFTNKPFLDVYAFEGSDCSPSKLPGFLPKRINTRLHDGPIAISADTNLVVVTRNYPDPNPLGVKNLFLEYFVRENGRWKKGKLFPFGNEFYSVQHPFYNNEEETLYFSSDLPGGHGGFDLYKSKWDGKEWQTPINLGPEINSVYDEVFPTFLPQGYLVYSTNHIETMGGLDIVLFRDGQRTLFPPPLNTPFDDYAIHFVFDSTGYFSSNRSGRPFNDNVYIFSLPGPMPFEQNFLASVIDKETKQPLEGVLVEFSSPERGLEGNITTDKDGQGFLFRTTPDLASFNFEISHPGFKSFIAGIEEIQLVDSLFKIIFEIERIPEPVLADIIPPGIASGNIVLYFENDVPKRTSRPLSEIEQFETVYELYIEARPEYIQRSASPKEELETFFEEVDQGMENLRAFAEFIYEQLNNEKRFVIDLAAFASPIATREYNARLTERRNASVINYFEKWNEGALKPFLNNGRLKFSAQAFGDTQAPPNVSASRAQRDRSVYSVEASRERRVSLFWKWDDLSQTPGTISMDTISTAYFVVAGSFKNLRSAEAMINILKRKGATNPGIMAKTTNGFYRVYFSKTDQMDQVLKDLEYVRRNVDNAAWVINESGASLHIEEFSGQAHYLIIGSFKDMRGAQRLLNDLNRKGITDAGILDRTPNGFYRVYYKRYHELKQAINYQTIVRQQLAPDAWILTF